MVTQTADDPANTNTQGVAQLGKRPSDDTLQLISSIPSQEDIAGRPTFNTVWGDRITTERIADIEEQFQYNINTKTLIETTVGNGASSQENSMMKLSSGTTTTGSISVKSKNIIRYRPSFEGWAYFTAIFDNGGVADSIQHIGPFDDDDGYFIGYGGTGVLGTDFVIGMKFGGVQTIHEQADWNGDGYFDANFDPTKLNIFRMSYGWLGTAPVTTEYHGQDGKWHVMHQMRHANTLTQPTTSNPQLPIQVLITKTAGATDIVMHTASWGGGLNGMDMGAGDRYFTDAESNTLSTEEVILNLQNVSTFQSKTNKVTAKPVRIGLSTDGTKNVKVKIYQNLTITSPTWADIDSTNSIMQKDTVGTVTPDDANLLWEYPLAKVDSFIDVDFDNFGSSFFPGDTITITGTSATSNDVELSIRWKEEF